MQPEPGTAESWMQYARADLCLAKTEADGELMRELLCFHAQQAVEKSIKSVLVLFGVAFPRIHSVERLIDLLPGEVDRPAKLLESAQLSEYATTFRYPGAEEPVSEDEYRESTALAQAVVEWAETMIASLPDATSRQPRDSGSVLEEDTEQ